MAIRETSNCLYPTAASSRAFAPRQSAVLEHRTDSVAGEPAARLSSLGLLRVFPPTSERAGGGASHPTPFPTSNRTRTCPARPHAEHREAPVAKVDSDYAPRATTRRGLLSRTHPAPRRQPSSRRAARSPARAAVGPRRSTVEGGEHASP